jgi:hypothetical protein
MARRAPALTVEITEGAIRVRHRGRCLTLVGAASPPDADGAPDFLILLDDIAYWDAPYAGEEVEIDDLQRILDAIEAECGNHGLSVEFE